MENSSDTKQEWRGGVLSLPVVGKMSHLRTSTAAGEEGGVARDDGGRKKKKRASEF